MRLKFICINKVDSTKKYYLKKHLDNFNTEIHAYIKAQWHKDSSMYMKTDHTQDSKSQEGRELCSLCICSFSNTALSGILVSFALTSLHCGIVIFIVEIKKNFLNINS